MGDKIAVDLGGTLLRIALVRNNKIIKYIQKNTPKEKNQLLKELVDGIGMLDNKEVIGIGIGSPGPLKRGIIKNPPNLPLKNFNLLGFLKKRFKKQIEIANDADCVAIAELKLGCKKKNFIVLTIGTGIGGGIIINSKLYDGEGYGGELGHIILDRGKDFESLAGGKKLKKITTEIFGKSLLIRDLVKLKDIKAKKILEEITEYLGQGIASLINIFDPEIVILNGGAKEVKSFLPLVSKKVRKYVLLPKKTEIKWSKLKEPGVLGASLLIK